MQVLLAMVMERALEVVLAVVREAGQEILVMFVILISMAPLVLVSFFFYFH